RFEKRDRRTLAVRTADRDHHRRRPRRAHALPNLAHAVEAHVDATRVDLLLVLQPFVEGFHDALTNTTAGAIRTATRIAQGLRNLRAVRQDRQQIGDAIAQFATVADHVDRAMFQQELRTLE